MVAVSGEANMKHAAIVLALGLAAAAGFGQAAQAEKLTDLAKQAASEAKDGKNLEAYDTIRKAALDVWSSGPLLFRKAIFVTKPPAGFGIYDPRADSMFNPGEKLFIYVEPVGFTWKKKDALNHAELVADLVLKDEEGTVLGEQKGFGTFKFDSREQNMEVLTSLTIDFTEAPPGKYTAELTFTDTLGDKSATFALPFQIKGDGDQSDDGGKEDDKKDDKKDDTSGTQP
jgi:hypothetical protein